MKKAMKVLLVIGLTVCIFSSAVLAASFSFNFYAKNSGLSYYTWGANGNLKTVQSQPWSMKLTSISVPSTGYGMIFAPFAYDPTLVQQGPGTWRRSTGITSTYYGSTQPAMVSYTVGTRVDNDYSTTQWCMAYGYFNADLSTFAGLN